MKMFNILSLFCYFFLSENKKFSFLAIKKSQITLEVNVKNLLDRKYSHKPEF